MGIKDVLYKETLVRVGREEMVGINRLIDSGHTGIAERHTVGKLLGYVRSLEKRLGINIPDAKNVDLTKDFIKVTMNGRSFFQVRS